MANAIVVRYRTKPESADKNAQLVRDVYDELAAQRPAGFHYMTLQLDDGVSFVHVAVHDEGAENPLSKSDAFARFQSGLADRLEQGPEPRPATVVGSYDFGVDTD
jgi:hypothetical protein